MAKSHFWALPVAALFGLSFTACDSGKMEEEKGGMGVADGDGQQPGGDGPEADEDSDGEGDGGDNGSKDGKGKGKKKKKKDKGKKKDANGDDDGDGVPNGEDNCPDDKNPDQADRDNDGVGDACDECPDDPKKSEPGDCGCGEPEDDPDGDGVASCIDNCPNIPNPKQEDEDGDGVGDACACKPKVTKCVNGKAGKWPCSGLDMVAHFPNKTIGAKSLNDIWGWVDPENGDEYAIIGASNGTSFVSMKHPYCPKYLGFVNRMTKDSVWRDIKVFGNYAYMVSEDNGGLQIFDMTRLRGKTAPQSYKPDNEIRFGHSHNVIINEDTGRMYVVLSNMCKRGLTIYDLNDDPLNPKRVGCWDKKPVHDAHCVVYKGPDAEYKGREICLTANDSAKDMAVVDVTDPKATKTIAAQGYPKASYSHQGWMSEDHRYYFHGDELDEGNHKIKTRTHMWDISDLDAPVHLGFHEGKSKATDHNMYIHKGLIYQANYRSGLRVLDFKGVKQGKLNEIAYFDTHPSSDSSTMSSAWSNFPFFKSNMIIVSATGEGFFILRLADQGKKDDPPE